MPDGRGVENRCLQVGRWYGLKTNKFRKMMQENLQERKLYLSLQSQNETGA